jgi:DNA topoisomerase-2
MLLQVAQLVGYISEKTAYHHGEQSLTASIVNLAQHFVGANNINVLNPSGQFGTRAGVRLQLVRNTHQRIS